MDYTLECFIFFVFSSYTNVGYPTQIYVFKNILLKFIFQNNIVNNNNNTVKILLFSV